VYIALDSAESQLKSALRAIEGPDETMMEALDALPAAIYITDALGHVTHYNRACVALAGRTPRPGRDRWCVTWKLFTADGDYLPHDRCPLALAIKQGREMRGVEAWAERPDGSRVRVQPFPTLLYNDDGSLAGAVNLLIDVTDRRRAEDLRAQAARCRRLSDSVLDRRTLDTLAAMVSEYEEEAGRLERLN
jgi:PAS domain S-box-containing protein